MVSRCFRLAVAVVLLQLPLSRAGLPRELEPPQGGANTTDSVVVIKGATILTVTQGTIQNGTMLLRGGKIAAVGADVPIPAGADIVDATGKFVSPGIIDCHSHIAVDSVNEAGTTVSSMTGIEDVFNPTDVNLYRNLAGGVTTANVLHGSANPIGGKSYVIKLRWGKPRVEDFAFAGAAAGLKIALGENPKRPGGARARQNGDPSRYPATRMGIEDVIRGAFTRAQGYRTEWQEYKRLQQVGKPAAPPRRDLQLEPLVEVLEGKRLVHAHAYRADEILMLIRLADELGFAIATFQHALEAYKVAKEIAAHGAGVSTFADWWGFKLEAADAIPQNAALLTRKGVVVSINSDSPEHARRLNTEAAKSVKWGGLDDDEALALVTINPARQLHIDHRVGSLEVGKDADLVIWNRHPLSSYAVADRIYIDGAKYYDRLDDEARLAHLVEERHRLVAAERRMPRDPPPDSPHDAQDAQARQSEFGRSSDAATSARRASAAPVTTATKGVLAITNARIFPIARPAIDRGAIVIRDGIIEKIGSGVAVPSGAQVIDAAGADVYPGFIDARSTIGLTEPGPTGLVDANDILDFNPQLRPHATFHNDSDAIPVARANGVTTVAITPGGGLLSGQVAVMNLDGWTWEESTVRPSIGVSFQFPPLGGRTGSQSSAATPRVYEDMKRDRDARLEQVARLLEEARTYAKAAALDRRTDRTLEALVPVVEQRIPLLTYVNTASDIREAIAFADRARVRIVVTGGSEAALVAPLLRDKAIPVILDSVLRLPTREDMPHQASYAAAGQLVRAGVKIAFSAGDFLDAENVRQLPYAASQSVAWGLPRDQALKALTIDAAEILGIADRLGSLEPGKIGNLFIARGDPLEVKTTIAHVIIAGRDVGLDNKQLVLYERYLKRP